MSALTDRYLDSLEREMDYDPALARRVRLEVEDHLCEAIAADRGKAPDDAERRAIERFGSPRAIAARFAFSSLRRQRKALVALAMVAIAGVFVAMKVRVVAVGFVGEALARNPRLAIAGRAVLALDRFTFWLALLAGLMGFAHALRAPTAAALDAGGRRWLRVSFLLSSVATAGIVACVAADVFLTAARMVAAGRPAAFFVALLSTALEVALAAILIGSARKAWLRAASTAGLLESAPGRGLS